MNFEEMKNDIEPYSNYNTDNTFSIYKNLFKKAAYFVSRSNYDSLNNSNSYNNNFNEIIVIIRCLQIFYNYNII